MDLRSGIVKTEGDLDFRATLGLSKDAPVGLQNIRIASDLNTNADAEQLATLRRLTERYCVVYQSLRQPRPIEISFTRHDPVLRPPAQGQPVAERL